MLSNPVKFFLLLSCCTGLFQAKAYPGRKPAQLYAMVIGISKYSDQNIPGLRFADKDAEAFSEFLRTPAAGALPEANISLLTNEKATRTNVLHDLVLLISRCSNDDMLIFYFAGHGKSGTVQETGYLMTYDADDNNEVGTAISMDEISGLLNRSHAKMKVSFIDACHAGLFKGNDGSRGSANDNEQIVKAYISSLANSSGGNASFMASSARQQSVEDPKLQHGVFTYYLLKGLKGEADMEQKGGEGYNDGKVTISEMITYLTNKVPVATKYTQTPLLQGVYDDDFPLSILRPDINLPAEIAKRPAKDTKLNLAKIPSSQIQIPAPEKLSAGMTFSGVICYGQYAFINHFTVPVILYFVKGFYSIETNIVIAPGATAVTPRITLYNSANSIQDCSNRVLDCNFFFKMQVNGVYKYTKVVGTVEAGLKSFMLIGPENTSFEGTQQLYQ